MANHHGNEGKCKVSTAVIAEVTAWSYTETCDLAEDTAMLDTAKSYKAGHKDGSGSITCWWDETDASGQQLLDAGASVTVGLYPEGDTGSGRTYFGAAVTVESVTRQGALNGIVSAEFTFRGLLAELATA
jgi:hypothetical protein